MKSSVDRVTNLCRIREAYKSRMAVNGDSHLFVLLGGLVILIAVAAGAVIKLVRRALS
jgi:hypothetical protein